MRRIRAWLLRFTGLFRRQRRDRELAEEIESNLQLHVEDNLRRGMTPAEARREAVLKFGGVESAKESYRDRRGIPFLGHLAQDVRFGLRQVRRNPGFTAVAILTLALGIGANTAIFSVVEGVVLAPLPFNEPDRLVIVWDINLTLKRIMSASYPDFQDWQRNSQSFQQMAALNFQDFDLTSPGAPEHLVGWQVSANFFSTLGENLTLGRDISPEEDKFGGPPVVIISDRLWRDRFAGSAAALGKVVALNGVDHTIIGVLPLGFHVFEDIADVYTPLGQGDPMDMNDRSIHPGILSIARLKPQVSIGQAQADMSAVQENLDQTFPAVDRGLGVEIEPLKQIIVGDVSGTLLLLLGAVGVVLLVACANVAGLLLARSAARSREFAVRLALGASRARIVRQLITESLLLSLAGAGLGLAIAKWGVGPLLAAMPASLPRNENISVNNPVLLFTFGVSIVVGILFGFAPALKSSKAGLQASLKEGGRGSSGAHHRAQSSLVIIQMALTLVLMVSAGLLFRTIRHLWDVNPGFDTQNIITFRFVPPTSVSNSPSATRIGYRQLIERIREIPGVQAADLTTLVPLSGQVNYVPFWIGSQKPRSVAEAPRTMGTIVGPDYLRVMGIRLLRGRFFNEDDTANSALVTVIDTALARAFFPDSDPVGQTMTYPQVGPYRIIGVVAHVRYWGLNDPTPYGPYQSYVSFYQISDKWLPVMRPLTTVIVRTPLTSAAIMPAIKSVVFGTESDQPVYDVQNMQQIVTRSMSSQRFPLILLATFAGLSLLLASVGIYGLMAFSVQQRTQEIGIRMALGAETRRIFRMVIGQGLRVALLGLAIGAAATLILTRALSSYSHLLYGVGASDPLTFAVVSLVLTIVAILACYIPARRAARVDPIVSLRHE
jgi:predicted permease